MPQIWQRNKLLATTYTSSNYNAVKFESHNFQVTVAKLIFKNLILATEKNAVVIQILASVCFKDVLPAGHL